MVEIEPHPEDQESISSEEEIQSRPESVVVSPLAGECETEVMRQHFLAEPKKSLH